MSILDKEYLAFSNATNLEWQYGQLKDNYGKISKLHELLSPDKFERKSKDGKFLGYPYMPDVKEKGKVTETQKKNGLTQMQNSAGVLMNYLEECGKNSLDY